jgi:membrane associated rhomboid family serine protease
VIFPIGDTPNPPRVPPGTSALIWINVLVFVFLTLPLAVQPVMPGEAGLEACLDAIERDAGIAPAKAIARISRWDLFVFRHGVRAGDLQPESLLFAMFLHANVLHLVANLLFLRIFGDNVEERMGTIAFLAAYVFAGMTAFLVQALVTECPDMPTLGASGAIAGILGLYFAWFPQNRVRLLLWLGLFVQVVEVPARWVLGIIVILDNALPLLLEPAGPGIAYGAHLGGFLAGLAIALIRDRAA